MEIAICIDYSRRAAISFLPVGGPIQCKPSHRDRTGASGPRSAKHGNTRAAAMRLSPALYSRQRLH
eukprot:3036179-Heterocapsa_arctica.AAC.1